MPRYENVPDDYNNHFVTCPVGHRYHASEGGCGQCDILREKAAERNCRHCGHVFLPDEFEWDVENESWFTMCPGCEMEIFR